MESVYREYRYGRIKQGNSFSVCLYGQFCPEGDESGAIIWRPQNCLATLENKALYLQGIVQELEIFCHAVLNGEDTGYTSLEFALEVMKVYEAALRSAGRRIEIERG
mgnify:CR=1 FL=1